GGAAVFMTGALTGLLLRLFAESTAQRAGDDYGLSVARLMLAPALSGVFAVAGVTVVGLLAGTAPALQNVLSLSGNPLGIVLAAVLGVVPSALVGSLDPLPA